MLNIFRGLIRPWFRLTLKDGGDRINGQQNRDKSLELQIVQGWSDVRLKLSPEEVERLIAWLMKTYRRPTNGKLAPVLEFKSKDRE